MPWKSYVRTKVFLLPRLNFISTCNVLNNFLFENLFWKSQIMWESKIILKAEQFLTIAERNLEMCNLIFGVFFKILLFES